MNKDTNDLILVKLDELASEVRQLRERLDTTQTATQTDEYMTVAQAAAYFKISTTSLYRLKHLQCRRGRSIRFKRQALDNHLRPRPYQRKRS